MKPGQDGTGSRYTLKQCSGDDAGAEGRDRRKLLGTVTITNPMAVGPSGPVPSNRPVGFGTSTAPKPPSSLCWPWFLLPSHIESCSVETHRCRVVVIDMSKRGLHQPNHNLLRHSSRYPAGDLRPTQPAHSDRHSFGINRRGVSNHRDRAQSAYRSMID